MPFDDETLRTMRRFEPASSDLADRIIFAAHSAVRSPGATFTAMLNELLASILPKPAFALAGVLALGVVIGLTIPDQSDNIILQAYSDEGATL